jgi:threonine aldolase
MLKDMVNAETGDDVYGEDPTVNVLEARIAEMTGKEAGLFVSSGTQSNLLALLSHCQRGDEYIAGQEAHTYKFEAGGAAVLGGIQPQPLPFNERGELDPDVVERAIKPDDVHFARTRLICLENTQGGKVLSPDYLRRMATLAEKHSLALHLDGARVFNAAVKLQVPVSEIAQHFDTVSICLSKGLAAPVGSLLVGDKDTITQARRWRKMVGGGMRQAGILAAAGLHALEYHVDRLADDHARTERLADALKQLTTFSNLQDPETNMVMLKLPADSFNALQQFLAGHDVTISSPRLVLHRDIGDGEVDRLIQLFREFDQIHG